ncbi:hypothetical protein GOP47_0013567 [Adiantum capillus-veneris]|uniref:Uncharacterized protein n=1 Tax=Adiantum capillus-veneris TaxID=13818 RepID=A0A9D4UNY7_ADICA|nr:hypothetical protein GOP47_0013567 [Adiantum capillus-veneris]
MRANRSVFAFAIGRVQPDRLKGLLAEFLRSILSFTEILTDFYLYLGGRATISSALLQCLITSSPTSLWIAAQIGIPSLMPLARQMMHSIVLRRGYVNVLALLDGNGLQSGSVYSTHLFPQLQGGTGLFLVVNSWRQLAAILRIRMP